MQSVSTVSLPRPVAQSDSLDPRQQLRAKLLAMIVKNEAQRKTTSS